MMAQDHHNTVYWTSFLHSKKKEIQKRPMGAWKKTTTTSIRWYLRPSVCLKVDSTSHFSHRREKTYPKNAPFLAENFSTLPPSKPLWSWPLRLVASEEFSWPRRFQEFQRRYSCLLMLSDKKSSLHFPFDESPVVSFERKSQNAAHRRRDLSLKSQHLTSYAFTASKLPKSRRIRKMRGESTSFSMRSSWSSISPIHERPGQ